MNNTSILKMALIILGTALIMCIGGIIWLSLATPAKPIPDILVGTTTLIVGGILGILVPTRNTEV